jgi:hypothetical protein
MRNIVLSILAFAIFSGDLSAEQRYLWPMKLAPELTSKFCDYRSGHFHAGIDIRTRGQTGFRIYAVGNGHISRVTTSFKGYGKAVYFRLENGTIVVYAHLSRFPDAVENRVFTEQMKTRRYSQDLYFTPDENRLKKGDIIGFSGESGAGAPHLHFEIRSANNNPINPLIEEYNMNDNTPPIFQNLAIKYFERGYLPDGSIDNYDQLEVKQVGSIGQGRYKAADTIISKNQLSFAISGGDRISGSGSLYGFYGLQLFVDDSLLFEMRSDSLSYSSTRQLNYVRDLELIRLFSDRKDIDNDANIYFRLYVPPLSRQYFWAGFAAHSGIINPTGNAGTIRKAEIVAFDENGNKSHWEVYIREPELSVDFPQDVSCFRDKDTIRFAFISQVKPESIVLEYRNSSDKPFRPLASTLRISPTEADKKEIFADAVSASMPVGARTYRLRFLDIIGKTSDWIYFREDVNSHSGLQINGTPDLLRIEYFTLFPYKNLKAHLRCDSQELQGPMRTAGPALYSCRIRSKFPSGATKIAIEADNVTVFDTTLLLYPALPHHETTAYSPDSTLRIDFDKSSSYVQAYIFASNAVREPSSSGLAFIYNIEPENLLVDAPVKYTFDISRLDVDSMKAGVYGLSEEGDKWIFIGRVDGDGPGAEGLGLGALAIIVDSIPPEITNITPEKSTTSRTPLLSCTIFDSISGLDLDKGVAMFIDGQWVPAEFDMDKDGFTYKIKNSLRIGKHKLEIKASDNQGNSITKTSTFQVIGKKK